MVKGTSRQVIVVQGPEEKLFEQAIFILKDKALGEGITDDDLMKEAKAAIRGEGMPSGGKKMYLHGAVWAVGGALSTALLWLLTAVF